IHFSLLALSLFFIPLNVKLFHGIVEHGNEIVKIMLTLSFSIGVPYFILSTTGPLVQHWITVFDRSISPYRFYALSNIASLLALLSYPFIVEPSMTLRAQSFVWSVAYAFFLVLSVLSSILVVKSSFNKEEDLSQNKTAPPPSKENDNKPGWRLFFWWLVLSASGSLMLLATTNHICQDIAVVPFLWVLPLLIYLLTFILCFNNERWYSSEWYALFFVACVIAIAFIVKESTTVSLPLQIGVFFFAMFITCMIFHGNLVQSKPEPRYLTWFYLAMATGGALGGIFVGVIAPLIFFGFWEYYIGLILCCIFAMGSIISPKEVSLLKLRKNSIIFLLFGCLVVLVFILGNTIFGLPPGEELKGGKTIESSRNFYGILKVIKKDFKSGSMNFLVHGQVTHGSQFVEPHMKRLPTTYYGKYSGVGLAMSNHPKRKRGSPATGLRVGVIGLGAGTVAVHAKQQDYLRFYEINPDVIDFSTKYFTFIKDSPAKIDIIEGDARVQMEAELKAEAEQKFDILVVDAFSGDSIPIHLLTKECAEIYSRHLNPDGILAIHITNLYLNMKPVIFGLAKSLGWEPIFIATPEGFENVGTSGSEWMIVTKNRQFLEDRNILRFKNRLEQASDKPLLWTDDYASLWHLLR
ncbi:MAG: fused MFS/spermidine synthase, partial [Nitrospinota bacterium]